MMPHPGSMVVPVMTAVFTMSTEPATLGLVRIHRIIIPPSPSVIPISFNIPPTHHPVHWVAPTHMWASVLHASEN